MLSEWRSDFIRARELAASAIDVSSREGFSLLVGLGTVLHGAALTGLGEPERGIQQIRAAMEAVAVAGARLWRPYILGMLARACWRLGNIDEAHARVSEALATAAQTGDHFYDAELHRIEGDLLLDSALPEARSRAEMSFLTAIHIAECQQAFSWKLRATMNLADLYKEQGRAEQAQRVLADVVASFPERVEAPDREDTESSSTA